MIFKEEGRIGKICFNALVKWEYRVTLGGQANKTQVKLMRDSQKRREKNNDRKCKATNDTRGENYKIKKRNRTGKPKQKSPKSLIQAGGWRGSGGGTKHESEILGGQLRG